MLDISLKLSWIEHFSVTSSQICWWIKTGKITFFGSVIAVVKQIFAQSSLLKRLELLEKQSFCLSVPAEIWADGHELSYDLLNGSTRSQTFLLPKTEVLLRSFVHSSLLIQMRSNIYFHQKNFIYFISEVRLSKSTWSVKIFKSNVTCVNANSTISQRVLHFSLFIISLTSPETIVNGLISFSPQNHRIRDLNIEPVWCCCVTKTLMTKTSQDLISKSIEATAEGTLGLWPWKLLQPNKLFSAQLLELSN